MFLQHPRFALLLCQHQFSLTLLLLLRRRRRLQIALLLRQPRQLLQPVQQHPLPPLLGQASSCPLRRKFLVRSCRLRLS